MTRSLYLAAVVCTTLTLTALGQKKPAIRTSFLTVTVVRDSNGKPVKNAEIVLHPVDERGRQKQEGLELKTHEDGKAETGGVPYGKLRIQVIAKGFKTYGQDYEVQQPSLEITIKLQNPADQFSIYK
jgi:hypothetical protein